MSTTARKAWLKILNAAGVRHFRAKSAFGLPYICHVGDELGEAQFYNRALSIPELALMAAWCETIESPVVFDIGANNGFIATQLAQLLRHRNPRIYAFEPVPSAFAELQQSVDSLGLHSHVFLKQCAISDSIGEATIYYDSHHSLFAQVRIDPDNARVGAESVKAETTTVDQIVRSLSITPHLLKVDVEGFEARVFKGASKLLQVDDPPAICFEWNPFTLSEVGDSATDLTASLANHRLHYVDDFDGQRRPFGEEVSSLGEMSWVCNIFGVPKQEPATRWNSACDGATKKMNRAGMNAIAP